jgi:hypothetical protein
MSTDHQEYSIDNQHATIMKYAAHNDYTVIATYSDPGRSGDTSKSKSWLGTAPQAGVRLEIPQLEKVGKLRQSAPPEAGKSYWMAFSNKGRIVKPGDHVNIVIGRFRADGLVVE